MSSGVTTESGSSVRIASEVPPTAVAGGSAKDKSVSARPGSSNNVAVTWICSLVASVLSLNSNANNGNNTNGKTKAANSSSKGIFSKKPSSTSISITSSPPASAVSSTPTPSPSVTSSPSIINPAPTELDLSEKPKDTEITSSSSSVSPSIPPAISPPAKKKTLILDLDETLVHSTIKPVSLYHMTVEVTLEGVQCTFFVIKRPHVDAFLKQVAEWYDVTIFTASMRQYADPLLDQLDVKRNLFKHRLFRESCLYKEGSFIKDLSLIGQDLATTIIIDNSPVAYSHNRDNALPIDNWLGDNPKDESLLNLLPFLDALRFTQDVRSILSLRVQS